MTAVNGKPTIRKDEVILSLEELVLAQERLIDWLIEELLEERIRVLELAQSNIEAREPEVSLEG